MPPRLCPAGRPTLSGPVAPSHPAQLPARHSLQSSAGPPLPSCVTRKNQSHWASPSPTSLLNPLPAPEISENSLSAEDDTERLVFSRSGSDSLTIPTAESKRADRTVTVLKIQQNWFLQLKERRQRRSVQPEPNGVSEGGLGREVGANELPASCTLPAALASEDVVTPTG